MVGKIRYDPLSKFVGLGSAILARIDGSEFPSHIDASLAAEIDALERRHACLFVVYEPKAVSSGPELCQYATAVGLSLDELADVRRIEGAFDVWLVAYHRSLSSRPSPRSN